MLPDNKISTEGHPTNLSMLRTSDMFFLGLIKNTLQINNEGKNIFLNPLFLSYFEAEREEVLRFPEHICSILLFINGLIKTGVAMPALIEILNVEESAVMLSPSYSNGRNQIFLMEILVSLIRSNFDGKITQLCMEIFVSINNWIIFREKEVLLLEDKKLASEIKKNLEENKYLVEKQIIQASFFLIDEWFFSKNDKHIEYLIEISSPDLNFFNCISSSLKLGVRTLLEEQTNSIKKIVDKNPLELIELFEDISKEIRFYYNPDFFEKLSDLFKKITNLAAIKRGLIWKELTLRHIFENFAGIQPSPEEIKSECVCFSQKTSGFFVFIVLESLSNLIDNTCQALNVLAEFNTSRKNEKAACEIPLVNLLEKFCQFIYELREHEFFTLGAENEVLEICQDQQNLSIQKKKSCLSSDILSKPSFSDEAISQEFCSSSYYKCVMDNLLLNNENLEKKINELFAHFLSISSSFFSFILINYYEKLGISSLNTEGQYRLGMYNYFMENFGSFIGNTEKFASAKRIYLRIRAYQSLGAGPIPNGQLQEQQEQQQQPVKCLTIDRRNVWGSTLSQLWRLTPLNIIKSKFEIIFDGEPGVDHGGLYREWVTKLFESVVKPKGWLFILSKSNKYLPDPRFAKLWEQPKEHFKFVGRMVAKFLLDGVSPGISFGQYFLKRILDKKLTMEDLKDIDEDKLDTLKMMKKHNLDEIIHYETFSCDGVDLVPNGSNIKVNEGNKIVYIRRVCQHYFKLMDEPTRAFKEGFNSIIPKSATLHFNEDSLNSHLAGIQDIKISEMEKFVVYQNFTTRDNVIIWLWKYLEASSPSKRRNFLLFITGSAVLPEGGFKALSPKIEIVYNNVSSDSLPTSRTCFNQLFLPKYSSAKMLEEKLEKAVLEGNSSGFGFC